MQGILLPIISLAGALLGVVVGAVLTQRYQRRNAQFARLHEDRIDAYSGFIDAVVEYRRTHMDRALGVGQAGKAEHSERPFAARSATWAAYYKVKLLAGEDKVIDAATETHALVRRLRGRGLSEDEIRQHGKACIGSLNDFAIAARGDILSGAYVDNPDRLISRGHVIDNGDT
jgi:hypothetical protein